MKHISQFSKQVTDQVIHSTTNYVRGFIMKAPKPQELIDLITTGNVESDADLYAAIIHIINEINQRKLTPLTVNVLLTLMGSMAKAQTDTPEKEYQTVFNQRLV